MLIEDMGKEVMSHTEMFVDTLYVHELKNTIKKQIVSMQLSREYDPSICCVNIILFTIKAMDRF